ncbi:MAG TPA: hypothetical protein VNI52_02660 [Sphingobacteriaceae bacterium]|nr:hypothetical protein [Sphingobacteriaceae bacterium]
MEWWELKGFYIKGFIILLVPCFLSAQEKPKLIPDAALLQHAGSIGYLSAGVGYDLFKNKKGNLDLLYGHVPESKGGTLNVVTAKFGYRPFSIKIKDFAVVYPANPGIFFSYTMGDNLSFAFSQKQYPKSYYGWSESFRSHLSVANEIEFNGKKIFDHKKVKAIVLYSEFNASDLYIVSWAINNKAISFFEIFKLGFGAKVKF